MPSNLHVGRVFKDENLPDCHCGGVWFKIPSWFAGTWQALDVVLHVTTYYDLRTKQYRPGWQDSITKTNMVHGVVKDNTGQIWYFPCVPYKGDLMISGIRHVEMEVEQVPIRITDEVVILRNRFFDVSVENSTIKSLHQYENIATFQKLGDARLKVRESLKTFDADGTALSIIVQEYNMSKVHDFQPVHNDDGNDLVQMFTQYLTANGMENLIMQRQ